MCGGIEILICWDFLIIYFLYYILRYYFIDKYYNLNYFIRPLVTCILENRHLMARL